MQKRVDFITVARSDYGIYRPVLEAFEAHPDWNVGLIVSGGHLDKQTGVSLQEIEADDYKIRAKIPTAHSQDGPVGMGLAMSSAILGLTKLYASEQPDIVFVLGDRYEMFAFCAALVPFNIPIAHIHGGELSFGAVDDVFRHAITKLSNLHFAATQDYADRIVRMGEEPWRVSVSGAPGLDLLKTTTLPDRATLETRFDLDLKSPPILVTFHPVTRELNDAGQQVQNMLSALSQRSEPIIITAPNLDGGHKAIRAAYQEFLEQNSNATLIESFGHQNYLAMLRLSAAVVGNSSSGIIETASFQLPTLNIGDRQNGRTRALNVVDVANTEDAIKDGLQKILDPEFRTSLAGLENPYGEGHAAEHILSKLNSVPLDETLIAKKFYDAPAMEPG